MEWVLTKLLVQVVDTVFQERAAGAPSAIAKVRLENTGEL